MKKQKKKNQFKALDIEKNKKLNSVEEIFLEEMKSDEIKNEIAKIEKWENKIK